VFFELLTGYKQVIHGFIHKNGGGVGIANKQRGQKNCGRGGVVGHFLLIFIDFLKIN
jgi:hypothetical protein